MPAGVRIKSLFPNQASGVGIDATGRELLVL